MALCALLAVVLGPGWAGAESSEPMRIGLLLDFSGSPETSADRKRGFDLAIRHINDGGGVLGRPVHGVTGDATRSPAPAVRAARHLVEQEGVHAVVGPNASGAALPVVEIVTGPASIPTISPSATSPRLTDADDDGFFFRTALADTAQGPVLARVTRDRGFENVGLLYHDDPYGQGLADTFAAAWNGTLRAVPVGDDQPMYHAELRRSAGDGAQALVVVTFEDQALAIVREAIDEGIYAQFVFADAAKRTQLVREVGGATLAGMYGTAGAPTPDSAAAAEWEESFVAEHGGLPAFTYVKETYDATIAVALAAQAAGSLDGGAIRDHLRDVGSPPGQVVLGTPGGVADALRLLAEGRQVDYEGIATTLDWVDFVGVLRRNKIRDVVRSPRVAEDSSHPIANPQSAIRATVPSRRWGSINSEVIR